MRRHIPITNNGLTYDNNFVELLYAEANEHLRENDKKRDQILIVIATLSGAIFGFYEKLKGLPLGYKITMMLLVLMLSIFEPFILITYRKWHIIYHLGAKVLQQIMYIGVERVSVQLIKRLLEDNIKKPTLTRFITTTETMIYNLSLFMNISNVYILFYSFGKVHLGFMISMFMGYLILYNYIHFSNIKELLSKILTEKGYQEIWLLDFIKDLSADIYENKYLKIIVDDKNVVKVINKNNGCVVVPITSANKIILIEIFRDTVNRNVLELPRGFAEESESTEKAALRELEEEIGGQCSRIIKIGSFYPDTGLYKAEIDVFLALDTKYAIRKHFLAENIRDIKEFDITEIYSKLLNGEIFDSYTVTALVFALRHILNEV
ncbi:NUDIX hydrolase [Caldicellulosiruptor naganoensis]|uniref:NUDIX hydrolase n=1 Tax=Caldicellulosiruptor naganoensis TaxID=29324 RepID=A0ABY7BFE1_9FIRM|nr:NUDIX hydrolase [Caldicellulosiruptor naganoensis]WAM31527.1 NUDIX hydrolase [Caldicellulosiruptor naganoensis]